MQQRSARLTQHSPRAAPSDDTGSSEQQQPQQQLASPPQQQQQQQLQEQPHGLYSIMAGLAGLGAGETAYLAATKLANAAAACPTSGCDSVLNSPYGSLFGLPLPLYGAATYAAVALAAGAAAREAGAGRPLPSWLSEGLAAGVGVLATTSGVLMAILHTHLGGAPCVWCYASAGLSGGLLALLVAAMSDGAAARGGMRPATAAPGLGGGTVAAALALALGFGGPLSGGSSAAELELAFAEPVVTTESSGDAVRLAARLRAAGAKMYGAFWCSHCYDQKQAFGAAAMREFPYVECFPAGWKKGVKIDGACEAAGVKAFPTWVIGGQLTEGQLELPALQELLDAAEAAGGSAGAAAAATQ